MAKVYWKGNAFLKKIDITNIRLVRNVANTIARKAKQKCPVKTGTLKRSIRPVVALEKDKAEIVAGGKAGMVPGVGTPVEYAAYVELGTRKQAAQPYLRPAVEEFSQEDFDNCIRNL